MSTSTALKNANEEQFREIVDNRRRVRMERVDAMSPALRACVNEYGLCLVEAFLQVGVTKPRHIRHIVEMTLNEFSPTRGSFSAQGVRADYGIRAGPLVEE